MRAQLLPTAGLRDIYVHVESARMCVYMHLLATQVSNKVVEYRQGRLPQPDIDDER